MGIGVGDGVVRGIAVSVPREAVLRRMGMGPSAAVPGRLAELVVRGMEAGNRMAAPAAVRETMQIGRCAGGVVTFAGSDFEIRSEDVARVLSPCARATLIGATIGGGISAAVSGLMDSKAMTEALILDAYGSEAVEAVVEAVVDRLEKEAAGEGFELTRRFSPGYGDWPLQAQHGALKEMGAARIGISANDRCILAPEKSVTAVVGWAAGGGKR